MTLKKSIVTAYFLLLIYPLLLLFNIHSSVLNNFLVLFYTVMGLTLLTTAFINIKKVGGVISLFLSLVVLLTIFLRIIRHFHYPGYGLLLLSLAFIILVGIIIVTILGRPITPLNILTLVFIFLSFVGYVFKLFHYPFSSILILSGFLGLISCSVIKTFKPGKKTPLSLVSYLLIIIVSISSILSLMHWFVSRKFVFIYHLLIAPVGLYVLVLLFILNTKIEQKIGSKNQEPEYKLSFD